MKPAKELAIAAAQGDLDTMRTLLSADPALAKDWQPIMDACFMGQVAAVELLLDGGADPNVLSKSNFKYRPLHRTIERKITVPRTASHVTVVKLLLARGADPLAKGTMQQISAIAMAALSGDRRFVDLLLSGAPEPDFFTAAVLGDQERVSASLRRDASLARAKDDNGWSALRYALQSRMGQDDPQTQQALGEIARELAEAGAEVDGLLDIAVYSNKPALVKLFLEKGAVIRDGDTLNHAACDGADEALGLLLASGAADLNLTAGTEHHGGYVPFGCTLTMRSVRGAKWFLDHGVDPNYVGGPAGESSLHVAVKSGAGAELLKLLVDRGADPNAKNTAGETPLAIARGKGQKSAIEFLTRIGAAG